MMAISEPYTGSQASSATETSLVSGTTTLQSVTDDGLYELHLDLNAMAITDEIEVKVYEKCRAGDVQRVADKFSFAGNATKYVVYRTPLLLHGWDMTIKALAGTPVVAWSIRKVN
jgi:hypothetical protein